MPAGASLTVPPGMVTKPLGSLAAGLLTTATVSRATSGAGTVSHTYLGLVK
jgi:hypothetical protein